jgi:HSP20 family protein
MRAMTRWNPFRDLYGMRKEMDKIFTRYEDDAPTQTGAWCPAVDIYETEEKLVLTAELPGIEKENVKINLENSILTIAGERKFSDDVKNDSYHRVERSYGSFYRSFTLPSRIDNEKIEAKFKDGVLEIVLPKKEEAKPRQIEVKVK